MVKWVQSEHEKPPGFRGARGAAKLWRQPGKGSLSSDWQTIFVWGVVMGAIIELLIDYEVLVAAVREALSSKSIDFVKGSDIGGTVFKLRHWQLGDNMGEVKVRKVGDHRSELFTEDPPYLPSDRRMPDADLVEQNKKLSRKIDDAINAGESAIAIDLLQQGAEVTGKIYEQEEELYRRKKRYFEQAMQAMFSGLRHDHLLQRALLAEGNEETIRQLASWAGEELPATTDEPQPDSGAVGDYREQRDTTKWYDEWIGKYLRGEIERKELNQRWRAWYPTVYADVGENPDMHALRQAISERKKRLKPSG
jgi:hypothetical protein